MQILLPPPVGMAVDMAIAEKAEVFVGNGVRFFFWLEGTDKPFDSSRAFPPTW
jgi:hypothetical protein